MLLKGSQRGGAKQLALHLMNAQDNDHIEIHAIEGFVASDIDGALREIYAISRATHCSQFMFSLSLSPPKDAVVTVEDYEAAIELAAERLGLSGQPHVVVFHEKHGRRHCHVVFSRIDARQMKGINLSFFKDRLNELAHELYLSHNWEVPKGFENREHSHPLNYGLTSYHEAKKAKRDPKAVKSLLLECWQISDDCRSFAAALEEQGFYLCRGDRRGFVALDVSGNIYSLSRWLEEKPKTLRARLGDPEHLPTIEEIQARLDHAHNQGFGAQQRKPDTDHAQKLLILTREKNRLKDRQRQEREALYKIQEASRLKQAQARRTSLRKGLLGLWDHIAGNRARQLDSIQAELEAVRVRDNLERLKLSSRHLSEIGKIQANIDRLSVKQEEQHQASLSGFSFGLSLSANGYERESRIARQIRKHPEHVLLMLSDKESVFTRNDIAKTLSAYIHDPQDYQIALAKILTSKDLIELQPDNEETGMIARYSTRDMITLERDMTDNAASMAMRTLFAISHRFVKAAINHQDTELQAEAGVTLSSEQQAAIKHVTGNEQLACVIGVAGAGKSTMLAAARQAWEQAGYRVLGAALAGKAAKGLEQSSGIKSKTLASYEHSWRNDLHQLQKGDVLVIDEAGMIGSKQMAGFISEAKDKGAKIVLVGDAEQLQPINAGAPFRAITQEFGAVSLQTVHRQKQDWQQQASKDFATGQTQKALQAYQDHNAIQFAETGPDAINALVEDYMEDMVVNDATASRLALAHLP